MSKPKKKLISLLLLAVLLLSYIPNAAFAEVVNTSDVLGLYYELDDNGNIIENTGTEDPTKIIIDEATGHYVNYSKVISETQNPNEYSITFSIETTQKLDDIEVPNKADVVLVFDVSTSMDYTNEGLRATDEGWSVDNTRWAAQKEAAKAFINGLLGDDEDSVHQVSIVIYGGMASSSDTSIAHKTICDWTNSAEEAIATFDEYEVVCQRYAQVAYGVTNTTSLRKAYFNDTYNSVANTNCEAGFLGAIEQLDKLTEKSNQFVVYMSDGQANVSYSYANFLSTGTGVTFGAEIDAINMAGSLKENYPTCELYTVGFGGEAISSKVLQMGEDNNIHVDRYYAAENALELKNIYEEIYELIDLLSRSWQVTDPISSAYTLNPGSMTGDGDFSVNGDGIIKWNLLGADYSDSYEDEEGNTVYIYTLTYTIKLDSESDDFDLGKYYTANGITTLTYVFTYNDGTINKESSGTGRFLIPTAKGKELNVTYKANGGTGSDVSDVVGWESDYTIRSSAGAGFSRTGYTFTGWNTEPDGSGTTYTAAQLVARISSDLTLHAQWIYSGNYTLTFVTNGGSAVEPVSARVGTVVTLNQTTIRPGYEFLGWYTDEGLTQKVTNVTLDSDKTVYAKWRSYTVTYDAGDGTQYVAEVGDGGNHAVLSYDDIGFEKSDYIVGSWNTRADGSGTAYRAGDVIYNITADITLHAQWTYSGNYTLTFATNGGSAVEPVTAKVGTVVTVNQTTARPGFDFLGWYADEGLTQRVTEVTLDSNKTVYAKWIARNTVTYDANGGEGSRYVREVGDAREHAVLSNDDIGFKNPSYIVNSWNTKADGSGTVYRPGDVIANITEDIILYAQWVIELNTEDHTAYIIGYENKTIRPENKITRAETATIFFRMLADDARSNFWKTTNIFSDVSNQDWYNNAVSTLANAGILVGDGGKFKGNDDITRAEFATIAARFDSGSYIGTDKFTDISGHWASEYINRAAERGWITGYPDGTFRPNQKISRAEAIMLINRVLKRDKISAEDMRGDMITWSDNLPGEWYYEAVQEATNSHEYLRREDGTEYWTKVTEVPNWTELQKQWASSN